MPIALRPFNGRDIEAADRVTMRAFSTSDSFRPLIERHWAIQPDHYWVAEASGEVAGTVAAVVYGDVAYIGMMAVEPDFQGQGIGTALLDRLFANLRCPTMLLDATEAGEPLYRKYGFVDEGFSYDLRGTPAGAGGEVKLVDDSEALIDFDAQTFGANRRHAIARLLAEPGARCVQTEAGFLIAQQAVLGPWIAKDPATAEALLAQIEPREYRVMMPAENQTGRALLERTGFTIRRQVRHMRRGKPFSREGRAITYGHASFALG